MALVIALSTYPLAFANAFKVVEEEIVIGVLYLVDAEVGSEPSVV